MASLGAVAQRPIKFPPCADKTSSRKRRNCANILVNRNTKKKKIFSGNDPCILLEPNRKIIGSMIDVRVLAPTPRGINEAARMIRSKGRLTCASGIVSVPTEKTYSLFCFVPFQKPTLGFQKSKHSRRRAWNIRKFESVFLSCLLFL